MFGGTLFVFCAVMEVSEDAAVNTIRKAVERRSSTRIPNAQIAASPARAIDMITQYPKASQLIILLSFPTIIPFHTGLKSLLALLYLMYFILLFSLLRLLMAQSIPQFPRRRSKRNAYFTRSICKRILQGRFSCKRILHVYLQAIKFCYTFAARTGKSGRKEQH